MSTAQIADATETLYALIDAQDRKIEALTRTTRPVVGYATRLAMLSQQQHGMRLALSAITGIPVRDL